MALIKHRISIFKKAPFLTPLISSVIGILFQWYTNLNIIYTTSAILLIFSIFSIFGFIQKNKKGNIFSWALVFTVFCLIGSWSLHLQLTTNHSQHYKNQIHSQQTVIQLSEPLQEKAKTNKANAVIKNILLNDSLMPTVGQAIIYFEKTVNTDSLLPATTILINKPLTQVSNSGNPGAFDYAQYALFQGITHQVFLKQGDFTILQQGKQPTINKWLQYARKTILSTLDKHILTTKEKGVAEALLIGYREDMDKDLNQAYANTGTIHVIAISGLHLGSIYLVLSALFDFLKKNSKRKKLFFYIKPIIIIIVLWLFTLLAGGAASILRSAIMFTCISMGDLFNRRTNIYNSLALSAFIIIMLNPFSLWDAGFQLSYAAVLSIVIFMQPIYKSWFLPNKWLAALWKVNAVTLAAQILTLPIILYHFHQFPNYFLVANLLAVPLSNIILGAVVLLLLLGWIPYVADVLAFVCTWLIKGLNAFIEFINRLPFATTNNIQHHISVTIILYALIATIALALMQKNKKLLSLSIGIIALLCVVYNVNKWKTNRQQKMVVYNISAKQAIDFATGENFMFVGDTSLTKEGMQKNFHILPTRIYFQFNKENKNLLLPSKPFLQHGAKSILLYDDNYTFNNAIKQKIDYVILSKNCNANIDSLAANFNISQIIIDASNKSWKAKKWIAQCQALNIPHHYVAEQGAFVGY